MGITGSSGFRRIAAAVAAAACALIPATASAHEKSFKTSASVDYEMRSPGGNAFTGQLEARRGCLRNRAVRIIRQGSGPVGSARTKPSGRFVVPVAGVPDGSYIAKVRKKVRRTDDHKHVCKSDRSPALAVEGDCANAVLSGGPSAADTISVDDDLTVRINGSPIFEDTDQEADNLPPIALGSTAGGELLRAIASNSTVFAGPMSIGPLWIHCPSRSTSLALDPQGSSPGEGDFGEIFYDETFVVPDFVP